MSTVNVCKMCLEGVRLKWQNSISLSCCVLELLRKNCKGGRLCPTSTDRPKKVNMNIIMVYHLLRCCLKINHMNFLTQIKNCSTSITRQRACKELRSKILILFQSAWLRHIIASYMDRNDNLTNEQKSLIKI